MKKYLYVGLFALTVLTESFSASVGIFEYQADWGDPHHPPQLGGYKTAGSASFDGGCYYVKGNGDGVGGMSDEGFFLYTELSGSQTMTGRVVWIDPNNQEWSKIGLMMRENGADPSSRYYWCMLRGASFGDRTGCERRLEHGRLSERSDFHLQDDPESYVPADSDAAIWFRLTRIAESNIVMSEWSYDGLSWQFGHSMTMPFSETIAWGIAITNQQDNEGLAAASVENLTISSPKTVIGTRSIAGPSYFQSSGFFQANDELQASIDLINISDESMTVDILETIPTGWEISDISDGGIESQGAINWKGILVSPGQAGSLHYHAVAPGDPNPIAAFDGAIENMKIGGVQSLALMNSGFGIFDGHTDIGSVETPGGAWLIEDVGEYEVEGGGVDVGGGADAFHFLFRESDAPFVFEGHIELDAYESDSDEVRAGLMVRDELTSDSAFAWIAIRADYWHDAQWRSSIGDAARSAGASDDNFGDFAIEKIGDVINLYSYSIETGEKTLCRSVSIPMTDPVYVGLAVVSNQKNALSKGFFRDLYFEEFDGWAERDLAVEILPEGGGIVKGNKIVVHTAAGISSNDIVFEQAPEGFMAQNIQVDNGAVSVVENTIEWTLDHLSGAAVMTYDLLVPEEAEAAIAEFKGTFAGLPVAGEKAMHPIVFSIPFIDASTILDGVLGEGEYDGAYHEIFDHADRTPPGVHLSPEGGEALRDEESASFYVFHNADFIYAAIDVVDHLGLDFESGAEIWQNDSIELYLDGNLSRSNPKESGPYGFQATVLGGGELSAGDDPPTMIALPLGGGASSDGIYWNAAARAKDDSDGYIVEYVIDKSAVIDPADRTIIGFDILVNSALNTGCRTGKWGYWSTPLGAMETDKEYWDDEQGWAIVELKEQRPTGLVNWPLF